MSCCAKLGEIVKKLLNVVKKVLAIVLIAVAVYFFWFAGPEVIAALASFEFLPAVMTTFTASPFVWGTAALGAALLLDGPGIAKIAGKAATSVGKVVGTTVGGLTSGIVGGVSASLFGMTPGALLLLGLAAYWLFFSDNSKDNRSEVKSWFKDDEGKKDAQSQKVEVPMVRSASYDADAWEKIPTAKDELVAPASTKQLGSGIKYAGVNKADLMNEGTSRYAF